MVRDSRGVPLSEGDLVAISIGNDVSMGTVAKIEEGSLLRGLSLDAGSAKVEQQQPFIVVQTAIPRAVGVMNGFLLAQGVFKLYANPDVNQVPKENTD